ncbi:peptidylglycine monooxygenase [Alcaligenaceae bacterium CGII-47]|nr:peptidylglycine monooxygenase [Alcaligenaceae bacterium CGII-47]
MKTSTNITVTLGHQRYHMQRHWPNSEFDFGSISDVTVLSDGRVAVLRRKAPVVMLLSADGMLLDQWDIPQLVCGHFASPRKDGGLLIADLDGHQILALDGAGTIVWTLGDPAQPNWMAPFNHPTSAFEDANGKLYVTDGYGNSCLHIYDAERQLLSTIGGQGSGPGQFSNPHAVIVTGTGQVLVCDREHDRVQIMNAKGEYLDQIGNLYGPMNIVEMPDGNVLVTDQTPRLSMFSAHGTLLGRCRTLSTCAHGVGVAPDGTIFLAEMGPDTLTRLSPIGG